MITSDDIFSPASFELASITRNVQDIATDIERLEILGYLSPEEKQDMLNTLMGLCQQLNIYSPDSRDQQYTKEF